jgi:Ca2+-binding RTX toxin-like protein
MSLARRSHHAVVIAVGLGVALLSALPVNSADRRPSARPAGRVSPAVSVVAPNIIGFESDPVTFGAPEPYTSRDNPTVHFIDSITNSMWVVDAGNQSNGKALWVNPDDPSMLVILLDVPTKRLSVLFGNDDPAFSQAGDRATLEVFRNGHRIARRHVTMNRNDLGDQTIEYRGRVAIDRATFVYNRAGTPINLIEIVDDITLAQLCAIKGDQRANTLNGTVGPNGICGLNGRDRIRGHGGNDALFGGGGADRVNGDDGNDLVAGGGGDDTLNAADGVTGNDAIYGGGGTDTCTADVNDLLVGCENSVVVPTGSRPSARRR